MSEEIYQDDQIDNLFATLKKGEIPTDNLKNYIDCNPKRSDYFHNQCIKYLDSGFNKLIHSSTTRDIDILIENGLNPNYKFKCPRSLRDLRFRDGSCISRNTSYIDATLYRSELAVIKYMISKGGILNNSFETCLRLVTLRRDQYEKINWLISEASSAYLPDRCVIYFICEYLFEKERILIAKHANTIFKEEILKFSIENFTTYIPSFREIYNILLTGEDCMPSIRNMGKVRSYISFYSIRLSLVKTLSKTYCLPIPLESKIVARQQCSFVGLAFTRGEMSFLFSGC